MKTSGTTPDESALKEKVTNSFEGKVVLTLPEDIFRRLETLQKFRGYPTMSAAARRCVEAYLLERRV